MKLLIVDDDRLMRVTLIHLLEKWGYEANAVGNGIQALSLLQDLTEPVIILLDWIMPEMNGIELCQKMQDHPYRSRFYIILLTAINTKAAIVTGLNSGADDFVGKPVHPGELLSRIAVGRRILEYQHSLEMLTEELRAANKQLQQLATIDPLTGIANRRFFDEQFGAKWRRTLRDNQPLSMILLDLDLFKQYNDTYGHLAGDNCLKTVAYVLSTTVNRADDLVARFGGEEFAVLLPNTDPRGAAVVAEAIRSAIFRLNIEHEPSPYHQMTASLGTATVCPGTKAAPDELIAMADAAMYQAKSAGRNTVKQANAASNLAIHQSMLKCVL